MNELILWLVGSLVLGVAMWKLGGRLGACLDRALKPWNDAKREREQADFRNEIALAPGGTAAWQELNAAAGKLLQALNKQTLTLTFSKPT